VFGLNGMIKVKYNVGGFRRTGAPTILLFKCTGMFALCIIINDDV